MRIRNLKTKLLLAVSLLVIGSGALIALVVTDRYSRSLMETLRAQSENMANAVALEAADKILINDQVALQKTLDHHMHSHPSVAYLFVQQGEDILAHTFEKGVPEGLVTANRPGPDGEPGFQKIAAATGERYLDISSPVFEGKAGILRLGFSEKAHSEKMTRFWWQMSAMTFGILLMALAATLFFVRRVTRPVTLLAEATMLVDGGDLDVQVKVSGEDELAGLAASFNQMVARVREYTRRLKDQARELERAHEQSRTFCEVVQEVGSLRNLDEIGAFLIRRFRQSLKCSDMVLWIFGGARNPVFVLSQGGARLVSEPDHLAQVFAIVGDGGGIIFTREEFPGVLASAKFEHVTRKAVVPFSHEGQCLGALVVACPEGCRCSKEEIEMAALILKQAAGVIERAVAHEERILDLQRRLESSTEFCGMVGKDPKMQLVYKLIEDIAPTDATVLIQGESGTGKELVARAIHHQSPRREKPFMVINCSAYPATLLESEIFGHEKGAFSGAIRQKAGRFEQAHGGTVFLDEIGEISASAQIKLLRVLQTQKFERVGGEETLAVDVRILAATNKDLLQEVKKGRFREDLFYRLNVIPVHLPALRARRNDIPQLARHFLSVFAAEHGKRIVDFAPEAMRLLLDHDWPGNVRELENSVEHAVVLAQGDQIEASDLPAVLRTAVSPSESDQRFGLVEHEKRLLEETLEHCGWNKKEAARRLGIGRSTLYEKLKRYDIAPATKH